MFYFISTTFWSILSCSNLLKTISILRVLNSSLKSSAFAYTFPVFVFFLCYKKVLWDLQTKSINNTHVYLLIENERRKKEEKHHILYVLINKICTWYFFQTKNKKKTLHCTMAPKGQILFFVKLSLFIFKLSLF